MRNICILGGSGFVGHSIAARLAAERRNVTILSRRRERCRDLLVLPTVQVVEGDIFNTAFLSKQFANMDAVINLVGILNEKGRRGKGFERAHVTLPAKIVEACRQSSVERLLHMSALKATVDAPSHYLRSKARGENLLHDAAGDRLHVTSFRASVIFGPKDSFINRFANLLQLSPYIFPLACPDARFQPVYVEDVAKAFVRSLGDRHTFGQRYELCGPKVYTLYELVSYIRRQLGLGTRIYGLGNGLSRLQATVLGFMPGKPFSMDNYRSLQIDSVCDGDFPRIFGFRPTSLESVVPVYLGERRSQRYSLYRALARRR